MMDGFYSTEELSELGFKSFGENVLISKKTSIYGAKNISIGSNVRVDDFCILIGNITIGNYVHLADGCSFHAGRGTISIDDYSVFAAKVTIYSSEIDFEGNYMAGPMLPEEVTNKFQSDVSIGRYVIVGVGGSIIAGSIIPDGVAIGAMSMVKSKLEPWGIYAGVPCKRIRERSRKLLKFAEIFDREEENQNRN